MKGKNLLSLAEFSADELLKILDLADHLKRKAAKDHFPPLLVGRSLAAVFEKPSTRTRVSLEVAMYELGGHPLSLPASDIQLSRGETVEDTARTLSQYVDVIAARVDNHEKVKLLSQAASVPVINALSNLYHPLQTLADLQTTREVTGRLQGVRATWVGDATNVCNSLLVGGCKLGLHLRVTSPPGYRPHPEAVALGHGAAEVSGGSIQILESPVEAVKDADIVMTDTFVSMGLEAERETRLKIFVPRYQVTPSLMEKAGPKARFMHCLPAHRGEEVTAEVIDGPQSIVWQQAENRLHTQKALLSLLLLDEEEVQRRLK